MPWIYYKSMSSIFNFYMGTKSIVLFITAITVRVIYEFWFWWPVCVFEFWFRWPVRVFEFWFRWPVGLICSSVSVTARNWNRCFVLPESQRSGCRPCSHPDAMWGKNRRRSCFGWFGCWCCSRSVGCVFPCTVTRWHTAVQVHLVPGCGLQINVPHGVHTWLVAHYWWKNIF